MKNRASARGALDDLAIPYRNPRDWREAVHVLESLAGRQQRRLIHAADLARGIRDRLESVFPDLDSLCALSCPWCPDPCCLKAAVYADFRDLVFLALSRTPAPPLQMRERSGEPCRYHTARGCVLPRIRRPWICTWYLCAEQKALVRGFKKDYRRLTERLEEIRTLRKLVEELFIEAVFPLEPGVE